MYSVRIRQFDTTVILGIVGLKERFTENCSGLTQAIFTGYRALLTDYPLIGETTFTLLLYSFSSFKSFH